jgi:hypothetical protein
VGTKFSEIYNRAVFKFTDYSFLTAVTDLKEKVLQNYLLSAIPDFQYSCDVDLTKYDTSSEEFEETLSDEIIEILSLGIAYYWLSAQVLNRELLKSRIHNKDYTSYSPANMLKEMRALQDTLEEDYRGKRNLYSLRHVKNEN